MTNILSAIISALPDITFLLDEEGRYLEILTSGKHLLYVELEKLKGNLIPDLIPKHTSDIFLSTITETLKTGINQVVEYQLDVPTGKTWFEGRTSPLKESVEGKRAVIWIAVDITERKLAEVKQKDINNEMAQRVEESTAYLDKLHAQLSAISDSLPIVTYIAKATGDYAATYVAPSIIEVTGFPAAAFTSDPIFFASRIHPEDKDRVFKEFDSLDTKRKEIVYRWRKPDGSYIWFSDFLHIVKEHCNR